MATGPTPSERRGAVLLMVVTGAGAAIAAGMIEWEGWQILYRTAGPAEMLPAAGVLGVPLLPWLLGSANTLSAAVGVGIGVAAVSLLLPSVRSRPWRALPIAFAAGNALLLGAIGALTLWAP